MSTPPTSCNLLPRKGVPRSQRYWGGCIKINGDESTFVTKLDCSDYCITLHDSKLFYWFICMHGTVKYSHYTVVNMITPKFDPSWYFGTASIRLFSVFRYTTYQILATLQEFKLVFLKKSLEIQSLLILLLNHVFRDNFQLSDFILLYYHLCHTVLFSLVDSPKKQICLWCSQFFCD